MSPEDMGSPDLDGELDALVASIDAIAEAALTSEAGGQSE